MTWSLVGFPMDNPHHRKDIASTDVRRGPGQDQISHLKNSQGDRPLEAPFLRGDLSSLESESATQISLPAMSLVLVYRPRVDSNLPLEDDLPADDERVREETAGPRR